MENGDVDGGKELFCRVILQLTRGQERKIEGLYGYAQPSSERNTSSNTEDAGVSKWLSLGPKTRAWPRLQLLMKQTSGDCDESSLEKGTYSISNKLSVEIYSTRSLSHFDYLVVFDLKSAVRLLLSVVTCLAKGNTKFFTVFQKMQRHSPVLIPYLSEQKNTQNIDAVSIVFNSLRCSKDIIANLYFTS
jgi:hypothetical protein